MGKLIITDKVPQFLRKNQSFMEMVKGHMAMDIEVLLKTSAGMPVKTGAMKSDTRHFKTAGGGYRVEVDKAYASYQERGRRADGSHVVRNYTTPGTSSGFFMRAIGMVLRNRTSYIDEARKALGL